MDPASPCLWTAQGELRCAEGFAEEPPHEQINRTEHIDVVRRALGLKNAKPLRADFFTNPNPDQSLFFQDGPDEKQIFTMWVHCTCKNVRSGFLDEALVRKLYEDPSRRAHISKRPWWGPKIMFEINREMQVDDRTEFRIFTSANPHVKDCSFFVFATCSHLPSGTIEVTTPRGSKSVRASDLLDPPMWRGSAVLELPAGNDGQMSVHNRTDRDVRVVLQAKDDPGEAGAANLGVVRSGSSARFDGGRQRPYDVYLVYEDLGVLQCKKPSSS